MPGMMSAEDMDAMATTTGADFDDMWLTMMIEHHQHAIEMATTEQSDGVNPDAQASRRPDHRSTASRGRRDDHPARQLTQDCCRYRRTRLKLASAPRQYRS